MILWYVKIITSLSMPNLNFTNEMKFRRKIYRKQKIALEKNALGYTAVSRNVSRIWKGKIARDIPLDPSFLL